MEDEELTRIEACAENLAEMHWTKPGKEFRYHGEMYDVVRIKTQSDKRYYYCICDKNEKQLIAVYNKTHKKRRKKDQNNSKSRTAIQLFVLSKYQRKGLSFSDFSYVQNAFSLIFNYLNVPSPPPKEV